MKLQSEISIQADGVSKEYRLGVINHGTLYRDMQSWWAKLRGRPDPNSSVGDFWQKPQGVQKGGSRFLALNDVSFSVSRGEVLGLIGGNGAGKSTLLKILSRITAPSEGSIKLRGRVASLLEVGTGFHPELTGRENIYLNGALLGMSRLEVSRKFDEIVHFSEVEDFIDTPVKRYSSGMYVRLAFAVAAHLESEILLVDEVLAVGDVAFQKKCLGKMGDIGTSGRTIIFVSHNMAAIESLCSKVLVLKGGRVAFHGDAQAGIDLYHSGMDEALGANIQNASREGDGRAEISDIWFSDSNDRAVSIVRAGSPLSLNFRVRRKQASARSLALAVGVTSLRGEGLLHLSTEVVGFVAPETDELITLRCTIPRWNIRAGMYTLNVHLSSGGVVTDWIQDAFRFQVEEGDYYGTGRLPPPGYSPLLADFSWSSSSAVDSSVSALDGGPL